MSDNSQNWEIGQNQEGVVIMREQMKNKEQELNWDGFDKIFIDKQLDRTPVFIQLFAILRLALTNDGYQVYSAQILQKLTEELGNPNNRTKEFDCCYDCAIELLDSIQANPVPEDEQTEMSRTVGELENLKRAAVAKMETSAKAQEKWRQELMDAIAPPQPDGTQVGTAA